jgi:SNF2 family DNA or RNA helicase
MTREEKEKAITTFKTTDINVFLMQIKCGGVGINLQMASRVYITCPNYNPCIDMQAVGRVYRKGQTKPVTAIRIMMKETVEERCLEISERKMENIKGALGEDNFFFLVGM